MSQTMSQTILALTYYQLRNLRTFLSLQSPEFFPLDLWTYNGGIKS